MMFLVIPGAGSLAYFSDDESGESSAHEDSDVIDSDRDFSDIDLIQDLTHTGMIWEVGYWF